MFHHEASVETIKISGLFIYISPATHDDVSGCTLYLTHPESINSVNPLSSVQTEKKIYALAIDNLVFLEVG